MITVAGATGDLGQRIVRELAGLGAPVTALVRNGASTRQIEGVASQIRSVDFGSVDSLAGALDGAHCVVSALSGLEPVILEAQGRLLDAAVKAGVPRFFPSDYAIDFRQVPQGSNRNLNLRSAFLERAESSGLRLTSVLNGAFMDMLTGTIPIVQHSIRRVIYWGSADQPMDFTTIADTARFTAHAAMDPETPRWLKISGARVTVRDIAEATSRVRGRAYGVLPVGSLGTLGLTIRLARLFAPGAPAELYPAWQGMQYLKNLLAGEGLLATPLDNERYPSMTWTSLDTVLRQDTR